MLYYTHLVSPALPVHDIFVLHLAKGSYGKLEEVMRRSYYERFKSDIKVSKEIVVEQFSDVPTDKNGAIFIAGKFKAIKICNDNVFQNKQIRDLLKVFKKY